MADVDPNDIALSKLFPSDAHRRPAFVRPEDLQHSDSERLFDLLPDRPRPLI
jgi:hypothetical protein